jgi:hypothetical protein
MDNNRQPEARPPEESEKRAAHSPADGTKSGMAAFERWARENLLGASSVLVILAIISLIAFTRPVLAEFLTGLVIICLSLVANIAWGRRDRIWPFVACGSTIAIIAGTVLCVLTIAPGKRTVVVSHVRREVTVANPPIIIISQPTPGSEVGPSPTIEGVLSNIASDQSVIEFSQPFTDTSTPTPENFSAPGEVCDLSNNHQSFTCPNVFNGASNDDYCREALLWVSVVNSRQLAEFKAESQQHIPLVWPNRPLNTYGATTNVLIHRNPAPGKFSCVASRG